MTKNVLKVSMCMISIKQAQRLVLKNVVAQLIIFVWLACTLFACKHEPGAKPVAVVSNFPAEVGRIMETKCAVSGCHNAASYTGAGGLLLDSWEHLFDGGNNGAVVVAYSPLFSSLLYFVNNNPDSGLTAVPQMPYNDAPLTADEYKTLKDWIAEGAPDANGNIPFASMAENRQKIYAIQQECDVLTVIDAEKNVVMRYIPMGRKATTESMIDLKMSPDGRYLYVAYWFAEMIEKIDTRTDKVVTRGELNNVFWSTLTISEDGSKIIISNEDENSLYVLNADNLQEITSYKQGMVRPRSVVASRNFDTLFAASRIGNTLYKIANNNVSEISVDGNATSTDISSSSPNPWSMMMSPDYSRYFVVCSQTNEVRVMDAHADTLIKVIATGIMPQQMAMSEKLPYLFVTCMEDPASGAKSKGSVYVINYNTLEVVKRVEGGLYEPYGISVDDRAGKVYVMSRNLTADGPAPHHGSPCSGRNGFYRIMDINTLSFSGTKRYEILANPTVTTVRFKQ